MKCLLLHSLYRSGKKGKLFLVMSKKRKKQFERFDLYNVKAIIQSNQTYLDEIQEHITALRDVDLQRLLSEKIKLTKEEALHLVTMKVGLHATIVLKQALQHVPTNLSRVTNSSSMRHFYVLKIFKALVCDAMVASMKEDDLRLLCVFLESYCPEFLATEPLKTATDTNVWNLTQSEGVNFNKFLTPPVSNCLHCNKQLSMHNDQSKATLFTSKGPIPCSKVSLECRDCSFQYGVLNYSNKEGTYFYPEELATHSVIEVSNVTYIDSKLYNWIPSRR